jgi:paraquat-inducible protein B
MKTLEDSLAAMMTRLPEAVTQMNGILTRIDNLLGDVKDQKVPEQLVGALTNMNSLLNTAERKLEEMDAGKISKQADKTLGSLNETVLRLNGLLARIDGDKGLLASVTRTSDAFGDTAHTVGGLGTNLDETLISVQEAAKSIHRLADALERDPDMLLKGRAGRSR